MTAAAPPRIFDFPRRRAVRDRAVARPGAPGFLGEQLAEALMDRLSVVQREFHDILLVGYAPQLASALREMGTLTICAPNRAGLSEGSVQGQEDALPFADASFDLIVNVGLLDSCNDLPGALILARRVLRPDGLFMAGFLGGGSLVGLRTALIEAEGERVAAHIHPFTDVPAAGDLLQRAGFALPVADLEAVEVEYSTPSRLFDDLRDYGGSNVMTDARTALPRSAHARLMEIMNRDEYFEERFNLLFLLGWAPHPDQPKPAARGSATASLGDALKSR